MVNSPSPALTVLGAGVAGLAASKAAREAGRDCVVYEASPRAGGLLDSYQVGGYRFDNAVHLSFADQPEVREVFDKAPHTTFRAAPRCVEHPHWLTYPVQNNLYALPAEERGPLIRGFMDRPDTEVRTYRDWLLHQYGEPLTERFAERYTDKYWTVPADTLGIDWIGSRIPRARLDDVLRGATAAGTGNVYPVTEVRYPESGGYRAFIEPLVQSADVRLQHRLSRLDMTARTLHFANGERVQFERLVSTLPMPVLVELIDNVPAEIRAAAATLVATTVDLVSIGIRKPKLFTDLWFYIYDADVAAARASCPGVQSADNCPPDCSSIQFEVYGSSRRSEPLDVEAMKRNCVAALLKWGFATEHDIDVIDHRHLPFGNVIFETGMEQRRDLVRAWLEAAGIHCAGRFGAWEYLWSHQAFESGVNAARAALNTAR